LSASRAAKIRNILDSGDPKFKELEIPGIIEISPKVFSDQRGFFVEVYKQEEFRKHGFNRPFVQVNHSKSTKGVLRGLHYQIDPMAQGKLITVVDGEIFDVAVDIRDGSPTYGNWAGMNLNAEKKNMLYIPEGFAHGFCVLSDTAQVIYYCTEVYSPEHERGIKWDDPKIDIKWPVNNPTISERDNKMPLLKNIDAYFQLKKEGH